MINIQFFKTFLKNFKNRLTFGKLEKGDIKTFISTHDKLINFWKNKEIKDGYDLEILLKGYSALRNEVISGRRRNK